MLMSTSTTPLTGWGGSWFALASRPVRRAVLAGPGAFLQDALALPPAKKQPLQKLR